MCAPPSSGATPPSPSSSSSSSAHQRGPPFRCTSGRTARPSPSLADRSRRWRALVVFTGIRVRVEARCRRTHRVRARFPSIWRTLPSNATRRTGTTLRHGNRAASRSCVACDVRDVRRVLRLANARAGGRPVGVGACVTRRRACRPASRLRRASGGGGLPRGAAFGAAQAALFLLLVRQVASGSGSAPARGPEAHERGVQLGGAVAQRGQFELLRFESADTASIAAVSFAFASASTSSTFMSAGRGGAGARHGCRPFGCARRRGFARVVMGDAWH